MVIIPTQLVGNAMTLVILTYNIKKVNNLARECSVDVLAPSYRYMYAYL